MESDGMPKGTQETVTVQCGSNNFCPVNVPAPGFALVFLTPQAQDESTGINTLTFSTTTTAAGDGRNTATIAAGVLATSNGHGGLNHQLGSTSFGSNAAPGMLQANPGIGTLALVCMIVIISRNIV